MTHEVTHKVIGDYYVSWGGYRWFIPGRDSVRFPRRMKQAFENEPFFSDRSEAWSGPIPVQVQLLIRLEDAA